MKGTFVLLAAVLLLGMVTVATVRYVTAHRELVEHTPIQVTEAFYTWYLAQQQNPLSQKTYLDRTDLSASFKESVTQQSGFDPFLCAQDKPESITVSNYLIQDDTATVETTQTFSTGKRVVPVTLTRDNGKWLITMVECGKVNIQSGTNASDQSSRVIYFSNSRRAGDQTDCNVVYGVERSVVSSQSPYQQALEELFKGPTAAEKEQGYSSFFSSKTAGLLKKLTVLDGVAYVNLHDPRSLIPNASSSCGSQQFLASIKETLMHDRQISKVVFAIDGDQEAFYDWLQIGCPNQETQCNDKHF